MSRRRAAGGVLEYSKMPTEVSGQSTGVLKTARRSQRAEYWSTQKCPPTWSTPVLSLPTLEDWSTPEST
jgi:hypothetical protein